jgi:hypothetical protein
VARLSLDAPLFIDMGSPRLVVSSISMTRFRALVVTLVALVVFAVTGAARADKVEDLSEQLREAKDFRVRTQAALALGASKTSRAIAPLCGGLDDRSSTVRAASAAALGKLAKGGLECLEKRLENEEKESVRKLVVKAIARVRKASGPEITDGHKYYVLFEIKDETGRGTQEIAALVNKGAAVGIKPLEEFVLAPATQSHEEAKALLGKHPHLNSVMLSTKVFSSFSGGTLTVKLEVAIFTFPDKNLKGTFSKTLSMSGLSSKSQAAENELIQTAAERAVKTYSEQAHKIR